MKISRKRAKFNVYYGGKRFQYTLDLYQHNVWLYEADKTLCSVWSMYELGVTPENFWRRSLQIMYHEMSPLAIVKRRYI